MTISAFVLALLIGGAVFTVLVLLLGKQQYLGTNANVKRLRRMMGLDSDVAERAADAAQARSYDTAYRAHLLLARFNIQHTLADAVAVQHRFQLALVGAAIIIGVALNLPLPLVLALGAVVYFIPQQLSKSTWDKAVAQVDDSLLMLITDISSLVQFTANPIEALEQAEENLRVADSDLLADELRQTIMDVQRLGDRAWVLAEERAQSLSTTLAMLYFTLGRLKQTGGARFGETFAMTADNLIEIQGVRSQINGQAAAAKSTMNMIVVVLGLIFANMLSSPIMRTAYTTPLGQMILAGSVLMMALGYWIITKRVEKMAL